MLDTQQNSIREYAKRQANIKIEEANRDYPAVPKNAFRLSGSVPQFGESFSIVQVEKINKIAQLQIQIQVSTIFDIFQIKTLSRLNQSFSYLKKAEDPHILSYSNHRSIIQIGNILYSKLQNIRKIQALKHLQSAMTTLKVIYFKSRSENSKRQMLRINSRMERQNDQLDLLDRNHSQEAVNSEKINKALVKRKQKNEKELAQFKSQFDQLLTLHQNFIKKKI